MPGKMWLFPYFAQRDDVSGIEVRECGEGGVLVELKGEFDRHNLEDLQKALSNVVGLRRPTLVDLSGVTFLDVEAARELTLRSLLYPHHLTLRAPSWQARASVAACGFDLGFQPSATSRQLLPRGTCGIE